MPLREILFIIFIWHHAIAQTGNKARSLLPNLLTAKIGVVVIIVTIFCKCRVYLKV
ncbi:hypothetical protein [Tolypothrix sp. NIES-4075]|uniref:hypothetical protein n=1 Tax=Tolypothrix sp. NIES-4075 TaxID=2005459 RepID=UPI001359CB97|nr:hypothetical protein [Tolypothrix sp. NIES-4075]